MTMMEHFHGDHTNIILALEALLKTSIFISLIFFTSRALVKIVMMYSL